MKRWLIFLTCYLFISGPLVAQQDWIKMSIDELEQQAERREDNHPELIEIWNELAFKLYLRKKFDAGNEYGQKALKLADLLNDQLGKAGANVVLGHMAKDNGALDQAEDYYSEAIAIRNKIGDHWGVASCFNSLGVLYRNKKGQFEKGIQYLYDGLAALKVYEGDEGKLNRLKAKIHNNLGDLLFRTGNYEIALVQFEKSRSLRKPNQMGPLYINEGACLLELNLFQSAKSKFHEAIRLFPKWDSTNLAKANLQLSAANYRLGLLDSALYYWGKTDDLANFLDSSEKILQFRNKGMIHRARKEYDEANENFQKGLESALEVQDYTEGAFLHFAIGKNYYQQNEFSKAINSFEACKKLVDSLSILELEKELYYKLSTTYALNNELEKAYATNLEYSSRSDSLTENRENALVELNRSAQLLNDQQAMLAQAKEKKYRNMTLIGIMALGLLLLFGIAAALVAIYNNQKRKLVQQQQWLTEQRLSNALQELEVERNYLQIDDSERLLNWVSKELHDRLGGMLSTIKLYFTNLNDKINTLKDENQHQFEKANILLDEVCEEVRRISKGALPVNLPNRGLVKEIEHMLNHIRDSQSMKVEFATNGMSQRLDTNKERKLYRVIHILVNNILLHAKADWFSLQINRFGDQINIMVEDNGIGFDPEKVKEKGGTGLNNLKSLCAELGATLTFHPEIENGTTVTIEMPVFAKTESL